MMSPTSSLLLSMLCVVGGRQVTWVILHTSVRDVLEGRAKEWKFFATSPDYGGSANKMGSKYLVLLSQHHCVRSPLPPTDLLPSLVGPLFFTSPLFQLGQPEHR